MLLEKDSVCKADFKTINSLRKHYRNKEIESLLQEKYKQFKDEVKVWSYCILGQLFDQTQEYGSLFS